MSETNKYRHLTAQHCNGNGCDIGSGGNPVVPWAIQVDLPENQYATYNSGVPPEHPIQWRSEGAIFDLPFKDRTLDWIYSSHLLEDFPRPQWPCIFKEWARVLKIGGRLIILVPDFERWTAALKRGQPPNCAHVSPEPYVGEVSTYAKDAGIVPFKDELTNLDENDYSILFVGWAI